MNILENKELLRSLLKKGDILNTINGGGILTHVQSFDKDYERVITIKAPSVPSESYSIVLNENDLIVFSVLTQGAEQNTPEELMAVPRFMKVFKIPNTINREKIEAVFEGNELRLILPFKLGKERELRRIKIRQI